MRKHMTRDEILRRHKEIADLKYKQLSAPHTGMAIMFNYILWTKYGYRHERIERVNIVIHDYIQKYYDEEMSMEQLQDRLLDKADFKVEYVLSTESDITVNKKNKFLYDLAKQEVAIHNEINKYSTLYIISAFNAMMDNGFGKSRLEKLKDEMNTFFAGVNDGTISTMGTHKFLGENGVMIELPKKSGCINF